MFKKTLAAVAAIALSLGIVALAAAPASAHQGDIHPDVVCNPLTGEYDVTYTLTWKDVPAGVTVKLSSRTGTETFERGWNYNTWNDWTDRGTTNTASGSIKWTESLPGTTKGEGPWVYAYTEWSNGYQGSTHHDTRAENLKGDCAGITPVAPAWTDAVCAPNTTGVTQGGYQITAKQNVIYTISTDGKTYTPATTGVFVKMAPGSEIYVAAEAAAGYQLTGYTQPFHHVFADPGTCLDAAPVKPAIGNAQLCVVNPADGTGSYQSGWIDIPTTTPNVDYFIDGSLTAATPGRNDVKSGTHTIAAAAKPGYSLTGYTGSYTVQVAAAQPCGDLIILPVVDPKVTFAQNTCAVLGSYTLAVEPTALAAGVTWTVSGGLPATLGRHTVTTPGTVTITATPAAGYGFTGNQRVLTWDYTFAAAPVDCLPTLALTGQAPTGGIVLAVVLLQAGLVLVAARFVRIRRARHLA